MYQLQNPPPSKELEQNSTDKKGGSGLGRRDVSPIGLEGRTKATPSLHQLLLNPGHLELSWGYIHDVRKIPCTTSGSLHDVTKTWRNTAAKQKH